MTLAEGLYYKTPTEAKDAAVDCGRALFPDETINPATLGAVAVSPVTVPALTTAGLEVQAQRLDVPGFPTIEAGRGLRLFLLGGLAGTVYTVTIPFEATPPRAGQVQAIEAALRVKVAADA